jgi:hypothetical protein
MALSLGPIEKLAGEALLACLTRFIGLSMDALVVIETSGSG